jgi:pimeloyl-ACP methyl ester carboxylesterase
MKSACLATVALTLLTLGCSPPDPADLVPLTSWQRAREEGRFLDVNGHRMFALVAGPEDATPIVLLHGNPDSIRAWRDVFDPLAGRYRVHAFDQLGFGFSDRPEGAPYSTAWFAENVVAYMDANGIERAVLVGNSMGGHTATETAILYPERVAALVLLGASGLGVAEDTPSEVPFWVPVLRWPLVGDLVLQLPLRGVVRERVAPAYYDSAMLTEDRLDEWVLRLTAAGSMDAYLARASQPAGDRREPVRGIRAPTLVITGDSDRLVPPAVARLYHELIPDSELIVLEQTGHVPQEERPERVVAEISRWADALP